ncbi:hypothetical protein FM038_004885 [Shewanella eurypsychrophilus]|uniref:Periplasmic protein n=1 Tax=Shewanella eurypsychrophilus TaxID=2593656 RepID=A0ABX6V4S3_9GAMM|nr:MULTISPECIES: hypothetical protein [Shewanella]QFU21548.1 hypothetical protein FS418_06465 [Shewanella sp. YLB-09]QPG56838.1 hypothetical protein FM038_004885 [Shewanella eurypsychrophilus]
MKKRIMVIAMVMAGNVFATQVPVIEDEGVCKCNRVSVSEAELLQMRQIEQAMQPIGAYLDEKTGQVVIVGEAEPEPEPSVTD